MWKILARLILRNRPGILIFIGILTVFMAWKGLGVRLSYENANMLPATDSAIIDYQTFKNRFGEDGSVFAIGVVNPDMFKMDQLSAWNNLTNDMTKIDGVEGVTSICKAINIRKNDKLRQYEFVPVMSSNPKTQAEADSIKNKILALKFYE